MASHHNNRFNSDRENQWNCSALWMHFKKKKRKKSVLDFLIICLYLFLYLCLYLFLYLCQLLPVQQPLPDWQCQTPHCSQHLTPKRGQQLREPLASGPVSHTGSPPLCCYLLEPTCKSTFTALFWRLRKTDQELPSIRHINKQPTHLGPKDFATVNPNAKSASDHWASRQIHLPADCLMQALPAWDLLWSSTLELDWATRNGYWHQAATMIEKNLETWRLLSTCKQESQTHPGVVQKAVTHPPKLPANQPTLTNQKGDIWAMAEICANGSCILHQDPSSPRWLPACMGKEKIGNWNCKSFHLDICTLAQTRKWTQPCGSPIWSFSRATCRGYRRMARSYAGLDIHCLVLLAQHPHSKQQEYTVAKLKKVSWE